MYMYIIGVMYMFEIQCNDYPDLVLSGTLIIKTSFYLAPFDYSDILRLSSTHVQRVGQ